MKYIFSAFLYFTIFLVIGCATKQGLYEGGLAEGWKKVVKGGDMYFYVAPTARTPWRDGKFIDYIQFNTGRENHILIQSVFRGRSVIFADEAIRVIPLDGEPSKDFPLPSKFGSVGAQTQMHLYLPETKNFKIELPRITLDGQEMPPLNVQFKWSDREYVVIGADPP